MSQEAVSSCACSNCNCDGSEKASVEKDGNAYCCQACADGTCQKEGSCKCSCA